MKADPLPRLASQESTVSVIVPCFNHGVFLQECLESVHAQTLPAAETIVVDDGSTDRHTLEVLAVIEKDDRVMVIRQANGGPSAARNRAIAASSGELVLPLDADNRLLPTALASMKSALLTSPAEVRWVYPHQRFFGNRSDLVVMPTFNLWSLLTSNFCDTGSLIDRSVFDSGCRYREDIGLGHEDWDFFLSAAERGFQGVPCDEEVLHVRKHGFTRSDLVNHQFGSFTTEIRRLHPRFFKAQNLLQVKQDWAPALSLVIEGARTCVGELLNAQAFQDFELVGQSRREGRFHVGVASESDSPSDALSRLGQARGRWVLLWSGAQTALIADTAFLEKAIVLAENAVSPVVVAFESRPDRSGQFNWRRADSAESGTLIGVLTEGALLHDVAPTLKPVPAQGTVQQLLSALTGRVPAVARRSFVTETDEPRRPGEPGAAVAEVPSSPPEEERPQIQAEPPGDSDFSLAAEARLAERNFRQRLATPLHLGHRPVTRLPIPPRLVPPDGWRALLTGAWLRWAPEYTVPLVLHFDPARFRYLISIGDGSEQFASTVRIPLGRVYTQAFPGTVSLWRRTDTRTGTFDYRLGEPPSRELHAPLGFVSTAHLPGMVNLTDVMHSTLKGLGLNARGRSLQPFRLGGEQLSACLEAVHPPPTVPTPTPMIPWPVWALYEVMNHDGRLAYSSHPDAMVVDGRRRPGRVVGRIAAPGRTAKTVVEIVHEATGARSYVNEASGDEGTDPGFPVLLGSLFTGNYVDTVPVVRLVALTPGPHSAAQEAGHRLVISGWEPMVAAGTHAVEGMLGDAVHPDPDQLPLYRWRRGQRPEWRYTLGNEVPEPIGEWRFDGTLGMAHTPTADSPLLTDFVELRDGDTGALSYAFADLPTPGGFVSERVIARFYRSHDDGVLPLFLLRGGDGGEVYTVNPDELQAAGYRAEGPVGFLGQAVPPPSERQRSRSASGVKRLTVGGGDTAVDGLVAEGAAPGLLALSLKDGADTLGVSVAPVAEAPTVGFASPAPFPWSVPLYELIERRTGRISVTTDAEPAQMGSHAVLRVVGFLGSPAHGLDPAAMEAAASVIRPPADLVAPAPPRYVARGARAAVERLPVPARRGLLRARQAVLRRFRYGRGREP